MAENFHVAAGRDLFFGSRNSLIFTRPDYSVISSAELLCVSHAIRTQNPRPAIQMKVHRIRILENIDRLIQAKRFHSRGVEYSRKADPPGRVRPITAGFFG